MPNNIPVAPGAACIAEIRQRYATAAPERPLLAGHFGTHGSPVAGLLENIVPRILARHSNVTLILIGSGSQRFREKLAGIAPAAAERIHATGPLSETEVSHLLQACDIMLQPYPDGITTRRTSAMAALAHGKPLVTTTGRLSEDLWTDSTNNGALALAPAGDAQAFAEAATRLVADDGERSRMSGRATELYEKRFAIRHLIGTLRDTAAGCG